MGSSGNGYETLARLVETREEIRSNSVREGNGMQATWETDLAELLAELSAVQTELLAFLAEKRQVLADVNVEAMPEMQHRETALLDRLQECHDRRAELLARASSDGLPADSLRSLSSVAATERRAPLGAQVQQATIQARLLQHHSLANWVLAQRALLHLSQLLEIIASGGRLQPTYGKGNQGAGAGVLLDQAG